MAVIPAAFQRRVCRVREVSRSSPAALILELIVAFPTYGYRRIWAVLHHDHGREVNKKKVYRIMKTKGWIDWYNEGRPHQAPGYLSPVQYRAQQLKSAA